MLQGLARNVHPAQNITNVEDVQDEGGLLLKAEYSLAPEGN